jgi:hypothetical protein
MGQSSVADTRQKDRPMLFFFKKRRKPAMNKTLKRTFLMALSLLAFSTAGCGGKDETKKTPVPDGYIAETAAGLMYDELDDFAQFYNYCPTVIVDGDKGYVWYCSNFSTGVVGDHIAYREALRVDGKWYWSQKSYALYRGVEGEWDSGNVCDPSVIKGEFGYKGETYPWLMTYLGCKTVDNSANMFGFAVAKSPAGPWVKVPEVSPLYDFYAQYPGYVYKPGVNAFIWGTGQSSIVSVDKKGRIMLFYTGGSATGQAAERWDFSDLAHPVKEFSNSVTVSGMVALDGTKESLTNADFVYDAKRLRFYVIADTHPWNPDVWPTNLPLAERVAYMNELGEVGNVFKTGTAAWKNIFYLNEDVTGFKRNHNAGFFRDPYGWMPEGDGVDIAYTMAYEGADWKVLYTYRIYRYNLAL